MKEQTEKLDPCPFCGGDAHVSFECGAEGWFIECGECFSRGAWSEDRHVAAAKWNRRAYK